MTDEELFELSMVSPQAADYIRKLRVEIRLRDQEIVKLRKKIEE